MPCSLYGFWGANKMTKKEIKQAKKYLLKLSPLHKGERGDLIRRYLRWKKMKFKILLVILLTLGCTVPTFENNYDRLITGLSYYKPNGMLYTIDGETYCKLQLIHKDGQTAQRSGRMQLMQTLKLLKIDPKRTELVVEDLRLISGVYQYLLIVKIRTGTTKEDWFNNSDVD